MKDYLIKLLFRLESATTRERIEVLIIFLLLITALWYFLVFSPQMNWVSNKKESLENMKKEIDTLTRNRQVILTQASSDNIKKLVVKYKELELEIQVLEEKISHYQPKFIDDKDLSKMLRLLLKEVQGVSIEDFSNSISNNKLDVPSKEKDEPKKPVPIQPQIQMHENDNQIHYTLVLKGEYFPIMFYLQSIEKLKWQIYWEKLTYTVLTYPQAVASIDFYTLKPPESQPILGK